MNVDMRNELKNYIGETVRLQFLVADKLDFQWEGTPVELKGSNTVLVFEHSPEQSDQLESDRSILDLRSAFIYAIDVLDVKSMNRRYEQTQRAVAKIACPHCKKPIYVIDKSKIKNKNEESIEEVEETEEIEEE